MASKNLLILITLFVTCFSLANAKNFNQEIDIVWGNDKAKILNNGEVLSLSLDEHSGSGFQSKNEFLYGKIDVQIKLVQGNSAGTVTSYYLHSKEEMWDEIDVEFLGNLSGEPYVLHTNVYTQGKGSREQQFYLWFDPSADFHTYSILWNIHGIIFYVDGTPIREFKNMESMGISYPKDKPMRLHSTLWDADNWATRGGLIKTDWSLAPFTAFYKKLDANACIWSSSSPFSNACANPWINEKLDPISIERMKWVQKNYMIYNYCNDGKRFPQGFPHECSIINSP